MEMKEQGGFAALFYVKIITISDNYSEPIRKRILEDARWHLLLLGVATLTPYCGETAFADFSL